ncbi:hypothetical protein RA263_14655 [Pseudomonas syringae pv. tagetis]|uniref:Uncharacterized protein n=1 Tax=Pseudomonas syringae pv. tagetis TaxID=129140 RepID=A0ABW7NLA8_9PSED|nr:hypothetical protein [Pseudomonas syringae group genomosp. 7]RMW08782.1 hypothetical protein ALO98_200410 [Pseudomonas syringae pv. tagetis]UNB70279.1 hypothetical protein MME58_08680 [Pseudomonas syringae pv. tagetis]
MTVDIEKLEALAKASAGEWYEGGELRYEDRKSGDLHGLHHDDERFIAAANPAVVLELTQTIRDLRSSVSGLKTGYEAYERVNAGLNQRIANLELCQAASLGVSGIIKSAASELGFDAAGEDSALDYLIGLARSAAALRAECEALRKDAGRHRWLSKRDRWASVRADFGVGGVYRQHRVCWYAGDNWPQAEGQSMGEAIDAAMSKEQSHD